MAYQSLPDIEPGKYNTEPLQYPLGTCMAFAVGDYSDYRIVGFLRALRKLDLPALAQLYNDTGPKDDWEMNPDCKHFPAWLVSQGYAKVVDMPIVHLGTWGDWEKKFKVVKKED